MTTMLVVTTESDRPARRASRDGVLLSILRRWRGGVPREIPQPDWARVPRRAWRRHSALLTCIRDEHIGINR